MGFLKDYTIQGPLIAEDAYYRIMSMIVDDGGAHTKLGIYVSRDIFLSGEKPLTQAKNFTMPEFDKNDETRSAHKQVYEWLLTLSEFEGATNVLEEEDGYA